MQPPARPRRDVGQMVQGVLHHPGLLNGATLMHSTRLAAARIGLSTATLALTLLASLTHPAGAASDAPWTESAAAVSAPFSRGARHAARAVPVVRDDGAPADPTASAAAKALVDAEADRSRLRSGGAASAALAPTALQLVRDFPGIPFDGIIPPNPSIAAGPDGLLAVTNGTLAVLRKDGALVEQTSLEEFFAPVSQPGDFLTDPRTMYDAGRYFVSLASRRSTPFAAFFLLAVSATPDPTGTWYFYALNAATDNTTPTNNFADLPGLGADANAVYLTANMFDASTFLFQGAKIRVVRKPPLLSGGVPEFIDFSDLRVDGSRVASVQPAQSLGSSQEGFFLNTRFPNACAVTVWRVLNLATGPQLGSVEVPVPPPCGIPPNAAQPDVSRRIETGGPRIINAVLRDLPALRTTSLWGAAAVSYNWGSGTVAAARVFEVSVGSFPRNVTLRQDFLQGADGVDVYYPAVAVDPVGNAALAFNQSSPTEYVSAYVAGQAAGAPRNQLLPVASLQDGAGPYILLDRSGRNRWGDYNGIAVDPVDGRFWVIGEYAAAPVPNATPSATPESRWGTWIGAMVVGTPPPTSTPTRTPTVTRTPTRTRPPTPTVTPTRTRTGTRTRDRDADRNRPDAHGDADPDGLGHPDRDADTDDHADHDGDPDAHRHANPDAHADPRADADPNRSRRRRGRRRRRGCVGPRPRHALSLPADHQPRRRREPRRRRQRTRSHGGRART